MALKIGGRFGFWLLGRLSKKVARSTEKDCEEEGVTGGAKLERHFGQNVWNRFLGKTVLDFGCGKGLEGVAVAQRGAKKVYFVDAQDRSLEAAMSLAASQGLHNRCVFLNAMTQRKEIEALYASVDYAYSLDSFEHFANPEEVLEEVYSLLVPHGHFLVSFGPPWKHPYGCHMSFFNSIPWVHLLFTEETIMLVRALYRSDGAKHFGEVEGGLNRMTVNQFLQLLKGSKFQIHSFQTVPAKGLTFLVKWSWSREYFTSVVRCKLIKPEPCGAS